MPTPFLRGELNVKVRGMGGALPPTPPDPASPRLHRVNQNGGFTVLGSLGLVRPVDDEVGHSN